MDNITIDYNQYKKQLEKLGWNDFFENQLAADDWADTPPARITQVHRKQMQIIGADFEHTIRPIAAATVGDWIALHRDAPETSQILSRSSLFNRAATRHRIGEQKIAANIDTGVVVSSCNADFNVARLERYCALVLGAGAAPVIVLTKADLCADADQYLKQAQGISPDIPAFICDARSTDIHAIFSEWCKAGSSMAFVGSSGTGKSTLLNTLCDAQLAATQDIRAQDAKGRHTTTHRQLYPLPMGGCLVDTPGMREVQLHDAQGGIAELFFDLHELAGQCKFNDCAHDSEPKCAVRDAVQSGVVDAARVMRWQKLLAEGEED